MASDERRTARRCLQCGSAHEGINGRYCRLLGRYVEHGQPADCPAGDSKESMNDKDSI